MTGIVTWSILPLMDYADSIYMVVIKSFSHFVNHILFLNPKDKHLIQRYQTWGPSQLFSELLPKLGNCIYPDFHEGFNLLNGILCTFWIWD